MSKINFLITFKGNAQKYWKNKTKSCKRKKFTFNVKNLLFAIWFLFKNGGRLVVYFEIKKENHLY